MNLSIAVRAGALASLLAWSSAQAASFLVDAKDNSSSGGTGLDTISLLSGQSFTVSVDPGDLWSAGALPRWSNAGGLTHDVFATGSDESGQSSGQLIGQNWGSWTQDGFTAPYGALVGQIGTSYYLIGTSFAGVALAAGTLKLFYWDENNFDNSEHIIANVSAVPEPETFALMLAGLGLVGFIARRRQPLR